MMTGSSEDHEYGKKIENDNLFTFDLLTFMVKILADFR